MSTGTEEVSKVREAGLLERLSQSERRIADLERQLRQSHAAVESSAREMMTALRAVHAVIDGHNIYPAFGLAGMIDASSPSERRKAWLEAMRQLAIEGPLASAYPHDGGSDPLRLLVRGSGGYGDMLYLSMYIRKLAQRFPGAIIHVMHEHPGVTTLFAGNPYIASADRIEGHRGHEFLMLASMLDVFDLIADVRYVVSYCAPPKSRIDPVWLAEANLRAVPWQSFARREWPYLNNAFARKVVSAGFDKYRFVTHTGHVEEAPGDWGDFFIAAPLPLPDGALRGGVLDRSYITVHHGADRYMAGADGLQTKNLPLSTWAEIVKRLAKADLPAVQLGDAHEALIPGISLDLRGKTSFAESAQVLRFASAHLDTEGGLVHLARAVGTRSVVAFGPTSLPFFGYPSNINIAARECGDCWWTTADWAIRCPRGRADLPCMTSHSAEEMADAAAELAGAKITLNLSPGRALGNDPVVAGVSGQRVTGGRQLILADNEDAARTIERHFPDGIDVELHVLGHVPAREIRQEDRSALAVPATWQRIAADENAFANAILLLASGEAHTVASLLFELARVMAPSASARLVLSSQAASLAADAICDAVNALPGGRVLAYPRSAPRQPDCPVQVLEIACDKQTADAHRAARGRRSASALSARKLLGR